MAKITVEALAERLAEIEKLLGGHPAPGTVVDPAPDGGGGGWPWPWPWPRPFPQPFPFPLPEPFPWPRPGPIPDPAPIDLGRLTVAQLELARQTLKTERARLDALETMIDEQIKSLG